MSDRQKKITWEDWVQEAEFAPLSPAWDKLWFERLCC